MPAPVVHARAVQFLAMCGRRVRLCRASPAPCNSSPCAAAVYACAVPARPDTVAASAVAGKPTTTTPIAGWAATATEAGGGITAIVAACRSLLCQLAPPPHILRNGYTPRPHLHINVHVHYPVHVHVMSIFLLIFMNRYMYTIVQFHVHNQS